MTDGRALFHALVEVLLALVFRLEEEFAVYVPMVETALVRVLAAAASAPKSVAPLLPESTQLVEVYRSLVQRVLRGHALPRPEWFDAALEDAMNDIELKEADPAKVRAAAAAATTGEGRGETADVRDAGRTAARGQEAAGAQGALGAQAGLGRVGVCLAPQSLL